MHIKLPNGVIIEDASEELVRSILGASFSPVVTKVEVKPVATAPSGTAEPAPAASAEPAAIGAGKKIHPLNKHRVPADGFDPLPPIDKCSRNTFMQSVLQYGMIRKQPLPLIG